MTIVIWLALGLMIVIFVLTHVEKRWADNSAARIALGLFAILGVLTVLRACGAN